MNRLTCRLDGCESLRAIKGKSPTGLTVYRTLCEWHRNRYSRMTDEQKYKRAARVKLRREVKLGRMRRSACEVCQLPDGEAHHNDYKEALVVVWLCRKHHLELHGLTR